MQIDPKSSYDVVIVGSGHNGLVAAAYLARAGKSVLILEANAEPGGATRSKKIFNGMDANLSVYSYLVSLFPQKIMDDLNLNLALRSRKTASWTPAIDDGVYRELLIRSDDDPHNRDAFRSLTGNLQDYQGYLRLQEMQSHLADVIWPSLLKPLESRDAVRAKVESRDRDAWASLVEQPLGLALESLVQDDLIRGMLFTDARIGISTFPHDPSLIQNRCFLYHVIGNGSGEWRVPVGGMQSLVGQLQAYVVNTERVDVGTSCPVVRIDPSDQSKQVAFEYQGKTRDVQADFVLCNASQQVLDRLLGKTPIHHPELEGAGFKMNMLLKRLPELRSDSYTASEAFAGTVHIDEGYQQMLDSYRQSSEGSMPDFPPGEIYCHTLTDDSILSPQLRADGYHTITLFGLDMPYGLFESHPDEMRREATDRYLAGINRYLAEPIQDCLATDIHNQPCLESMSAFDLEQNLSLPRGNIFHGDLSWPFADLPESVGQWGVETEHDGILICGSAAMRGGAVSGVPGHNAAMKVLNG